LTPGSGHQNLNAKAKLEEIRGGAREINSLARQEERDAAANKQAARAGASSSKCQGVAGGDPQEEPRKEQNFWQREGREETAASTAKRLLQLNKLLNAEKTRVKLYKQLTAKHEKTAKTSTLGEEENRLGQVDSLTEQHEQTKNRVSDGNQKQNMPGEACDADSIFAQLAGLSRQGDEAGILTPFQTPIQNTQGRGAHVTHLPVTPLCFSLPHACV